MYEVFQMEDDDSMDPDDGVLVEIGKVEVENDASELPAPNINNNEFFVYEPATE